MNKYIGENRLTYLWGKIKAFVSNAISGKVDKVSSSTDNAVVRFDGTSGNIQNSGVTIDDSNNVSTAGDVKVKDLIVHGSNTSNDTRLWTSSDASNMYAKIGGISPLVVNSTEVRRGVSGTSINLGSSTYPWNNAYAKKWITNGGTSSQFVKGDGSLDSNTYLTSSSLSTYAPLASPALTGTPTAPTAASGTNTTQIATTEFVQSTLHESTATYDITLNGTKAEGWYRVAKLGRTFSGIVSIRGTYASTLSTVATFSISGRSSNVACDIIQLSGEVQGNISKIRLVSGENSDATFYLDIYKATSGNISATYLTFNGTFETLEDATSTTVLDTASTYVRKVCEIKTITEDMYVTTSTFNDTVGDIETLLASI